MRPTAVVPPAALLVAVLLVGGCAGTAAPPASDAGTPTGTVPATAAPPAPSGTGGTPSTSSTSSGPFNGTDIAWLQLTVAMHERVLPMLDLVPRRTADPAVRRLAARIRQTHHADLARSRALLARTGAPQTNPHEGHDMPGMVTAAELETLAAAGDAEFRRLFGRHLRAHLEQSVRVAGSERLSGAEPATTALAAAIVRSGTAYLGELD